MARGAGVSFIVRVLSTLLMLAMQVVLARMLGVNAYGVYAFATAVMNVLMIFGKFGFDNTQLRFVAAYRGKQQWDLLAGLLSWTQRMSLTAAVAVTAVVFAVLALRGGSDPRLVATLFLAAAAVPFLSLSGLRQAALRGLNYVVLAQLPESILRPLLLLSVLGGFWIWRPDGLDAPTAMALTLAVAVTSYLVGDVWLRRRTPDEVRAARPVVRRREWLDMAVFLLAISLVNMLLNRTDVLLIGSLLGTQDVGAYSAASRLATVIQFGLQAVSLVAAPLIAEYHALGRVLELRRVIALSGYGILGTTAAIGGGLVLLGPWVLGLFGRGFAGAYPVLAVLALGQLVNALTGPASFVMSMTGAQRVLTVIMSSFLAVNVLLTLLLLQRMGVMGAAVATSATTIGWNVTAAVYVYRKFGINCFAVQRMPRIQDGGDEGAT